MVGKSSTRDKNDNERRSKALKRNKKKVKDGKKAKRKRSISGTTFMLMQRKLNHNYSTIS